MKRFVESIALMIFVLATTSWSCGQNGPTPPTVTLSWTQSTTPGVTANCVYRGTTTKVYTLPALFCSTSPATSYTDTTVARGTTYFYAVTAQVAKIESAYSNEATAPVIQVNPPTSPVPTESRAMPPATPPAPANDTGMTLSATVHWGRP